MLKFLLRCLLVVALSTASLGWADDFFFRDGDSVVMIGDSITEQHLYSNYVEMWTVTRFPGWKLTFRNVGISGDRSVGGNSRFARDVLLHKPTAMTVDFGMNDGGYSDFSEETYKPYIDGLQGMADQAKAAGIRVAWITPQPLDTDEQGSTALTGYNQTLEKFSAGVKQIAEKNAGLFVDQFHPYLQTLDRARRRGPKYDRITDGDAIHPGPPGQALMAASILKGLNFPTLVASAEISAATGKVVSAKQTTIDQVTLRDGGLSFTRLDQALPFFPADAASILSYSPILEELNDYRLKITGLAPGTYEVRLNGTPVTRLTAEQLAEGANLAASVLAAGPIADQVQGVREAVEAKNRYYHDEIFRGLTLAGVSIPDWLGLKLTDDEIEARRRTAVAQRLEKMSPLDAAVAESLKMKPHTVDIVPVK